MKCCHLLNLMANPFPPRDFTCSDLHMQLDKSVAFNLQSLRPGNPATTCGESWKGCREKQFPFCHSTVRGCVTVRKFVVVLELTKLKATVLNALKILWDERLKNKRESCRQKGSCQTACQGRRRTCGWRDSRGSKHDFVFIAACICLFMLEWVLSEVHGWTPQATLLPGWEQVTWSAHG